MADDDDVIEEVAIDAFEDPVAQRAIACVTVGKAAIEAKDDEQVRGLLLTMMRKLNGSIKAPSEASLTSIAGGKT